MQIVSEVLSDHADAGRFEGTLSHDDPTLEYTVQFRESDMDFVRRMLERHGISYRFQHDMWTHTMVLSDMVESHPSIGTRPYHPAEGHHQQEIEHFQSWQPARRIGTGAVRLTDCNFKKPNAAMAVEALGDAAYPHGKIESFDWPGDCLEQGRGKVVARLHTGSERGQDRRFAAEGDIPGLAAGTRVTLSGDAVPGRGEAFLCRVAEHRVSSDSYGTGTAAEDFAYAGRHILMPSTAPMVPERKTQRADVCGPQTAKVVGEGEIDCDEYGRILVQFHWDTMAARSMRCHVSQNWAGAGWGGMVIPRIGMEVVVDFLDGDPDQPRVTGGVFNGANPLPYDLPAHKTRSTFRTNTHQGRGFNELRFEDKAGAEEIFVHGQKDMNVENLNDRSERIGRDQSEQVGNDKSIEVGGDHDEVISGNMSIAVGQNPLSDLLMAKTKLLFDGVGKMMGKLKIPDPFNFGKGNYQLFVEKNRSEVVGVGSSEIVGAAKSIVVGHTFQTTVGKARSLILRGRADVDVGQVMNIRVGDQLTIKVGENAILTMSKEGNIVIKGKSIMLKADKISQD
ncbi:type VI secretion system secreted protein VgrG [Rhodobacter viridis]|uniref:Type VI secretion system secreted protein VgrG n=1 Tax=Rhodobacter viridis TaxID=1054202 RepID=A0A318U585_9RHOB|nr:type VI secretion system secreted protein VgrG [Rhodobacter viridis]